MMLPFYLFIKHYFRSDLYSLFREPFLQSLLVGLLHSQVLAIDAKIRGETYDFRIF